MAKAGSTQKGRGPEKETEVAQQNPLSLEEKKSREGSQLPGCREEQN